MRVTLAKPLSRPPLLAAALGASLLRIGAPTALIGGVATDSREVQQGDLFVALPGTRQDGRHFVCEALSRGAVGILADSEVLLPIGDYWYFECGNAQRALQTAAAFRRSITSAFVIGISGSTGKTTVKEAISAVLSETCRVQKSEGNFNSDLGMPLSLLSMQESDCFVLEVGISHKGEMAPLAMLLAPDLAILTNVGNAHIGNFDGFSALLREKIMLSAGQRREDVFLVPESLPPEALDGVLPRVLRFGTGENCDIRAENIRLSSTGTVADVRCGDRCYRELSWHVPGSIGVSVLLLAAAVAGLRDIEPAALQEGLRAASLTAPRLKMSKHRDYLLLDDTYNASPEAVVAALESAALQSGSRPLVAVLGDMEELGREAERLHLAVGEAVAKSGAMQLFAYGRYAETVARGARASGMSAITIFAIPRDESPAAVAELILKNAPSNAVLLFKASRRVALERVIKEIKET